MDQKAYRVTADRERCLLNLWFAPVFLTEDVARAFETECIAAAAAADFSDVSSSYLILVDLTDAVLQAQAVYDRVLRLIGGATARRLALVASAPPARMQTKRLQIRNNVVMFAEAAAAEEWLFGEAHQAAA